MRYHLQLNISTNPDPTLLSLTVLTVTLNHNPYVNI